MSEKKAPETPVDRYKKLTRSLKHQKKVLEYTNRDISKIEKELSSIMRKLWFCPQCNQPQQIPNKKNINEIVESKLDEDGSNSFYKCRYVQCQLCNKYVLIDKTFIGKDD